jgi:succinate dehydrogenase / fumarate reductase cytochrome b subunit
MPATAINPKGARPTPAGSGPAAWIDTYLASTVGRKVLVALTGLGLTGFVVFHMIGNLKLLPGGEASRDAINGYAYFLKHELGVLIWVARGGLLTLFLLHLFLALWLKMRAGNARPVGYVYQRRAQATPASTTMLWTGLVVGAFVVFHLAHYTLAWVTEVPAADGRGVTNYLDLTQTMPDGSKRHDVYAMMVHGFKNPVMVGLYLIAQVLLGVHLSHGVQSAFQTLGLVGRRFTPAARALGYLTAAVVIFGNSAIVLAVFLGYVK